MKATQVVSELKSELDVGRNDEIVPAVQALLQRKMPMGVLVLVGEDGQVLPHLVGVGRPTVRRMEMLQAACEKVAGQLLMPEVRALREREIEARVRAQVEEEQKRGGEE